MNASRHLAALCLLLCTGSPAGAEPGASAWAGEPEGRVRLLSERTALGADGSLRLGVQLSLAPGWHTFWREPGEAGAPPTFDWSGSENVAGLRLLWPAPRRFQAFGLDGHGWEDEVVFPVEGNAAAGGLPVRLRLKLDYQICEQICIPASATLALDLPAGAPGPTPAAALVERWRSRVPAAAGEGVLEAALSGVPGSERLTVRAPRASPGSELFAEAPPPFRLGRPAMQGSGRTATFILPVIAGAAGRSLAGLEVRLTLVDGARALERVVRPPARP